MWWCLTTAIISVKGGGFSAREVIYILIENYIPFGYANRISREKLVADTRLSDRKIRREMEEAEDVNVPLLERLKFTEIFTSNLDPGDGKDQQLQ